MKNAVRLFPLISVLLLAGCAKDSGADKGSQPGKPSPDFSWQTTKQTVVNIVSDGTEQLPVFIYDGDKVVAAGYTPFHQTVTTASSCEKLTVASWPLSYAALFGVPAKGSGEDDYAGTTINFGDSKTVTVDNKPNNAYHTYLVSQAQAWLRGGFTWKEFVKFWNTSGGPQGQSGINVYQNRPPVLQEGANPVVVLSVPHNCHDKSCSENSPEQPEEDVTFSKKGTYIFEDLFPSMGDYDMNDFVVEENAEYKISANNIVKSATVLYQINAAGSSSDIAMAVKLFGIENPSVSSIKMFLVDKDGNEMPYTAANASGLFSLEGNGKETSPNAETVIPVFDKLSSLLPSSASGMYFNTVNAANGGKGTPIRIKMVISFVEGKSISDLKTDVFIMPKSKDMTVQAQRGREIHVADAKYTHLMNTALFNTGDDASVLPSKTFRSKDGYVWGIYLPVTGFRHPLEKEKLTTAYPQFEKWVVSNGSQNQDWYKFPSESKVWKW